MKHKKIIKFALANIFLVLLLSGCFNSIDDAKASALLSKNTVIHDVGSAGNKNYQGSNGIRVSLSLLDSQIKLNQPLRFEFRVENNSPHPIKLDLGMNFKGNFLFAIVFPDGKRIPLRQYDLPATGGIYLPGNVSIDPQKTYAQTLLLNDWVDLNQIGAYKLEGRLKTRIETADKNSFELPPFSIEFNLEEGSANDVIKSCEAYLKRLEDADSSDEAIEIAAALTVFKNPVVVPCITRAIALNKGMGVESSLINGLRDQGGVVAVDVLIGIMKNNPNSRASIQAKAAVEFLEQTTSDKALKLRIRSALDN